MFKFFNRLIILLFIAGLASIGILIAGRETDESLTDKYSTEASGNSKLIGRFIEHIIHERGDNLKEVAAAPTPDEMARQLQQYASFIDKHYNLGDCFSTGITDSGFEIIKSITYGADDCSVPTPRSEEAAARIRQGKVYLGYMDAGKSSNMILIYPVMRNGVFSGAVYDIFTVMDDSGVKGYWSTVYRGGKSELLIDSVSRYGAETERGQLLRLKKNIETRTTAKFGNRQAGFYEFTVHGTKFVLIYLTEPYKRQFVFSFFPWAGEFAVVIVFLPLGLLILLIIIEMFKVNRRLADEIKERTLHLNSLSKKYESLFQTIPEYVVVHDKDGNIIEQNNKCRELGISAACGCKIFDFIREKEKFRARLESMGEEELESFGEFGLIRGDGEVISISASSILMETEGRHVVLSLFTDITDYKSMQNSFYLAQRREAVGTLASGMAHDFSNILQNIALQFSLAERADDDDKRELHLVNINGIVEGAKMYIQKVLQSAKETEETPIPRFGRELTATAIDISGNLMPPDVKIEYNDSSDGMMINIIESRYIQMMVNLCQNASEAMEKKGIITVSTGKRETFYGSFFELKVKDTGRGMDKTEQRSIFKPFYTTKERKGAGLGLATVKQVVMDNGGFIEVNSAPGEGCEFTILLPESK
ncbi:two-component system sensor histidine kinase NtrB [Seleniivibrio woodruffii]|uniref:histidine kinase n=1 Tax=Seleniivibrio woodruffii TaxID=1078050 RepID=A0A4R1KBZ5_9BACT|nr:ATP-binding protein [Seleniivibrio woodruffii]TCK61647.1 PAS domain S-box-containing protein [Seleniivibrio woodruffii]TVZ35238.1 PAS domain S-box-containing protein [Seleniivibrio woodruffii]